MKWLKDKKINIPLIVVIFIIASGGAYWGVNEFLVGSHINSTVSKQTPLKEKTITEKDKNLAETKQEAIVQKEIVTQKQEKESNPNIKKDIAISNKKYGWGLKKNKEHQQPEMPSGINSMLKKYNSFWVGGPDEKVIYLTFDEGYENGYSPKILDILKANDVKAAFFVTGHYINTQPDLVKRMVNEGHIVGNHTETHPSMPDISDDQIKTELITVNDKFKAITGKDTVFLRPPMGEYSERTLSATSEMGYYNIFWSIALVDWVPMQEGPDQAYRGVMDNLHNGAIILLHAISKDDTEALDKIIKDAKAQGYSFKTLEELVKPNNT